MWSARPSSIPAGLFAQLRFDLELIVYGVLLILLIVAGCVVVVRVRRWWRDEQGAPVSVEDQIKNFYVLVERGELDPKEFERIKARLEQARLEQTDLEEKAAEPPIPPDTRIQAMPSRSQESGIRDPESGIRNPPSGSL